MVSKPAIFALFTALGLLHFVYRHLEHVASRDVVDWRVPLANEMTGAYGAMALLPWVVWVLGRQRWWWHVPGVLVYSAVKTSLLWASRELIWWGTYDYGVMPVRYLMELPGDVIGYSMTAGVVLYLRRLAELERIKLENLNLQLQPHFLFNAMNAVSAAVYEDPRRADLMLSRLAEYLRRTLQRGDAAEVELEQELEMLDLYVSVMKARFEDRLVVEINVQESARRAMVPQGVLQPVVENAIRHGGAGRVTVSIEREGIELRMRVRDEGKGDAAQGLGIGLKNTQERLRHLYGRKGWVTIEKDESGTEVRVGIPCRPGR